MQNNHELKHPTENVCANSHIIIPGFLDTGAPIPHKLATPAPCSNRRCEFETHSPNHQSYVLSPYIVRLLCSDVSIVTIGRPYPFRPSTQILNSSPPPPPPPPPPHTHTPFFPAYSLEASVCATEPESRRVLHNALGPQQSKLQPHSHTHQLGACHAVHAGTPTRIQALGAITADREMAAWQAPSLYAKGPCMLRQSGSEACAAPR